MYRIMQARNGYYYVQKLYHAGWSRCSVFFRTKKQCRDFIDSRRSCAPRVVEYY